MDTYDTQTVGHDGRSGRREGNDDGFGGVDGGESDDDGREAAPNRDAPPPARRGRFGLRPGATKRNALFALLYLLLALVSLGVIRLLF